MNVKCRDNFFAIRQLDNLRLKMEFRTMAQHWETELTKYRMVFLYNDMRIVK